ncbi:MAG: hypothetical protein U9N45_01065, partial [Gemmatimonadota bacterium]|nr:hypothetical protein [Gemmatimonadota bacterium]
MKFLRGSPDQLQGRAVFFLDLKEPAGPVIENGEEMSLLAVICAVTEMDLLELIIQVMHLPREHSRLITRFYKRYFQEIESIKSSFPSRISNIIDEVIEEEQQEVSEPVLESFREMFRRASIADEEGEGVEGGEGTSVDSGGGRLPQPEFYSTMIPLPGREFISIYTDSETELGYDVIDLERNEMVEVGHLVLDAESRLYVADYMNQKEKQIDLPAHKEYESPYKNYKHLSRAEFKRQLSELSSELMFLIETGSESG